PMFIRPSRCNCCVPPHFVPQRFATGEPMPLRSLTMLQARRSLDTAHLECPAADRRERSERGRSFIGHLISVFETNAITIIHVVSNSAFVLFLKRHKRKFVPPYL